MNKKLIALALAALPVAAMADVTLYGTLNVGLQASSITNAAGNSGVHDYTSLLGFKGNEDLGNGLKAIWQIETGFNAGNATNTSTSGVLASRQTFVGLDGGELGKIRMGTLNSALKDQFKVDQWQYDNSQMGNTVATAFTNTSGGAINGLNGSVNGLALMTAAAKRLKNAVRYDTANFGGFTGNIEYGFGENKNQSTNVGTASNIVALGLNYQISDFALHYAYQREANPKGQANPNPKAASINYGEVDYKNDAWFVGLAYSQLSGYDWADGTSGSAGTKPTGAPANSTPATANLKSRQAALSVAYTIGAWTPKASAVKGWNQSVNGSSLSNTGYKQYVVGVDYALSKRTTTELAYGRLSADQNSSLAVNAQNTTYSTLALSVMHSF